MSKRSFSIDFKLKVINELIQGYHSINEVAYNNKVDWVSIDDWRWKYEKYGVDGLKEATTTKKYSKEFKMAAIQDYLSGYYSLREITRKYEIPSTNTLRKWIKDYNDHRDIKATGRGMSHSMTKGRSTTLEERMQIVLFCLENGKDYQRTALTYQVSYQQVYQWVKKYEDGGEEALWDKRGKKKEEAELSPEQKIKLEMQRLERENVRLRAENAFPKKVRGDRKVAKISQVRFKDKYIAIQELHQEENFSITLLCTIAGIVRSAYYKWQKRTPSVRERQNEEIIKEMMVLHEEVKGIFGYRRMTLNLNRRFEESFNHKRIYRLMKIAEIQSVIRKKKKRYKQSTPQHVAENILNREFKAEKPNEKWVTDVTELQYGGSKKAYLSAIRDLYDGSIVSYVLGHSNNNKLVFKTFDQATALLEGAHPLIHSDRGFQYTHQGFKRRVDSAEMTHSMSRVGKCIDNGPMESFWGTLKSEKYYLEKYETFKELSVAIDEYIHFYNYDRYQERLKGLSPMEYRAKAA
ncbi:IS3 family transposase [Lederbergia citri]|uniref:IS3 family transposase n=1 Tax=Lederbergia citri TaxID=2833580 RepID=A0A942TGA8_9BACI|nr:IS3 family transposase [Lederbergia citri]MBS4195637.1 IS3 family transposase [Lederbergia citri]